MSSIGFSILISPYLSPNLGLLFRPYEVYMGAPDVFVFYRPVV